MEQKKHNLRVVNLSGYEVPNIQEHTNKDWVSYGDNNDYFDRIIERYAGSPTNARCINGIVDMVYGKGLDATNSAERPVDYARMKRLMRPKQIKRIVHDYKMLGQAAIQVVYNMLH